MNKDYPFPGEVTLSAQEYADLILELEKVKDELARVQADEKMYHDAFVSLQKKHEELIKAAEDNF